MASYDDESTVESTTLADDAPEESTVAWRLSATPSQRARQAELSASKTAFRDSMLASATASADPAGADAAVGQAEADRDADSSRPHRRRFHRPDEVL